MHLRRNRLPFTREGAAACPCGCHDPFARRVVRQAVGCDYCCSGFESAGLLYQVMKAYAPREGFLGPTVNI